MKNRIALIFIIGLCLRVSSQQIYPTYSNAWQKVYMYEVQSLPKSALAEVEKIFELANKDNNAPQLVKTLIYKSKFALTLEENTQLKVVETIKHEIARTEFPAKNVLESVLANIYWQYFQQNRWKIYNRTKTKEKVHAEDFRTWDLQTLFQEAQLHYQNSLVDIDKLQKSDLRAFNAILTTQRNSKKYRPTVFDFLAHRAIDFYKNEEAGLTRPSYKFEISNSTLLCGNLDFLETEIVTKDSLSQHLSALKLYKELTKFHSKDKDPTALIDITLNRLGFVNANAVFENRRSIYLGTLFELKEAYKAHEVSTEIDYVIASFLDGQANEYVPLTKTENRFKRKEAIRICEEAIKNFPNSIGSEKCEALKTRIEQKQLNIRIEKFVPINTPSRILVNYKNLDKLYFKAYKISETQKSRFHKIYNDSIRTAFVSKLEQVKTWQVSLTNEQDFQNHTTEVLLPPLRHGNFLIVATMEDDVPESGMMAFGFAQITDLALVQSNQIDKNVYQVVDRNTGKPIAKARVNLKSEVRGNKLNKDFITDKNGQFSFETSRYHHNVMVTVKTQNDKAIFGQLYINGQNRNFSEDSDEEIVVRPFVFTDRSIYRPGQTVYFKVIAIKKQGKKTEILPNEYIEVILEDPNEQDVQELNIKLNEFGSASGEFVLPSSGLTGTYNILIDESYEYDSQLYDDDDNYYGFEDYFGHTISVEEYKRPKFETKFEPVTNTYRLNDSITVKGRAMAFAGSTVSDAKVSYRVMRTAQFPRWYHIWPEPSFSSDALEIVHGETNTNASGEFEIVFKAIPDLSINEENQPTFNYTVFADVTDLNGETRSSETLVKVGYHTLNATISVDDMIDKKSSDHHLKINTENLNGAFVATKGTIRIFKLKASENPLRVRPWQVPDYQNFTEEEFRRLFPHDAYTNDEHDETKLKKGELVYERTFDTEKSREYSLGNIKKWVSGLYLSEIECSDKNGQKVKDEQRFTVFATKEKQVADNKLFFINTDKVIYKHGETVELQVGSAAENVTVTIEVEKKQKTTSTYFVQLSNETKTLKIPVTENDSGGFGIKYHFVCYNSFNAGQLTVIVPYDSNRLSIETMTFRDRLQPGSEQKWSFKIKNDKNDRVAAEILAAMYDASLGGFKTHSWAFDPIQCYQYSLFGISSAHYSFGDVGFTVRNLPRNNKILPQQLYDHLNWFGFSFNNNQWVNRNYLSKVERPRHESRSSYDKTVSGVVTDADNLPLPGVNVLIEGTTFGTTTDFDGYYSINVKSDDKLIFSYIGFNSTEVDIDDGKTVNVQLEEDTARLDEVVVVGYATETKRAMTSTVTSIISEEISEDNDIGQVLAGKVAGVEIVRDDSVSDEDSSIVIRGLSSISNLNNPLFVVDGTIVEDFNITSADVLDISILKDEAATALYGAKAVNGVVIILTRSGQAKLDAELSKIQARKNLRETAFFYPHLLTDEDGNVSFEFTVPEALTRWNLQLLAHTKNLKSTSKTLSAVTQKELMVIPNVPRFLREGDEIVISTKIANLSSKKLSGTARLELIDAIDGSDVTKQLLISPSSGEPERVFTVDSLNNTQVSWRLKIVEGIQTVQYKIIAKAGDFSDGEQNLLPVLINRMLVTETLPMWVRSDQTKTFTLDKLKNVSSKSLKHHKLALEMTSNPAWYAVQALPYLMEYPYDCNEQIFSRYYANSLASHIANSNPRIQEVFNQWRNSDALLSDLEKNQELKSLLIQETPWLRDARSETEQKKRIALLFDLNKMRHEQQNALSKLRNNQKTSGAWAWFNGGPDNRFITQHIITGLGHLKKLAVTSNAPEMQSVIKKAISYLDNEFVNEYERMKQYASNIDDDHLSRTQIHYLYMRSFFKDIPSSKKVKEITAYYKGQTQKYWMNKELYSKGMLALVLHRMDDSTTSGKILRSLKENSITSEELGMYWKANTASLYWYQAPIETQALLIEAFQEIENDTKTVDNLKIWLLKNKQTNQWETTKATTEAVYALLLQGSDWLSVTDAVEVLVGGNKIEPSKLENTKVEAGTGYFKTSWNSTEITPKMSEVLISKKGKGIAWGALYWQYFEDLDKITSAETPLQLKKKLFLKKITDTGEEISEITDKTDLNVGDLVRVRIELRSDREMEFVHMKDMRASGMEPINVSSQYKWQDGLGYYESTKDASTNFFFDYLPKGVFVFEYDLRVNNAGEFSNGITTIQSMYAPEFSSHSKGVRIIVN